MRKTALRTSIAYTAHNVDRTSRECERSLGRAATASFAFDPELRTQHDLEAPSSLTSSSAMSSLDITRLLPLHGKLPPTGSNAPPIFPPVVLSRRELRGSLGLTERLRC